MTFDAAPAPEDDPGHLLPDEEWARVVADAEAPAPLAAAPLTASDVIYVPAKNHSGTMPGGKPTLACVHSAETPIRSGYARSLAVNWFGVNGRARSSAHVMVDPGLTVRMLPKTTIAWHCGNGNRRSIGYEQAGYAHYSRAQWLTSDGRAQMERLAREIAADCVQYGIPLRWATDQQIRDAHYRGVPGGLCTHDDMRRVLGGTTHTDPLPHYPKDLLLAAVKKHAGAAPEEAPTLSVAIVKQAMHEYFLDVVARDTKNGRHYSNSFLRAMGAAGPYVLAAPIRRGSGTETTIQEIADSKTNTIAIKTGQAALEAQVSALQEVIRSLAARENVDLDEVEARMRKVLEDAVIEVDVNVGVPVEPIADVDAPVE